MKTIFLVDNADWLSELPSFIKKYNNTNHSWTKKTPVEASRKLNENLVFDNLHDNSEKQNTNFEIRQIVPTADIKRVFSKGASTNYSYKFYTFTEVLHDTILNY